MNVFTSEIIRTAEIALPRITRNHESGGIQEGELHALLCMIGIYFLTGWRSDVNREELIADFIAARHISEEQLQIARDRYEQYRHGADTTAFPRALITAMVAAYRYVPRQQVLQAMKQDGREEFSRGAHNNKAKGLPLREINRGTKPDTEGNFGKHPADE